MLLCSRATEKRGFAARARSIWLDAANAKAKNS